jgi:ribonuclease HI
MKKIICYTDGGARGNPGPAGAGAVIMEGEKTVAEFAKPLGNATNNFAEYAGVVLALTELKKRYGKKTKELDIEIRLDSELVARQLSHQYQVKEVSLVPQFMEIHNLRVASFPNLRFVHVRREQNKDADRLANEAMDRG